MDNRVICNCTFSVFRYIRVGFMNIYLVKKRRINVSSFFWFPFYFDTHISCTRFIFGFLFEKQQENGTNTTIYIHNQTEKKENLLLFWNVKKREREVERLENKTNIAIAHSFRTESSQWIALTELFKQASLWFIHIDLCVCVCVTKTTLRPNYWSKQTDNRFENVELLLQEFIVTVGCIFRWLFDVYSKHIYTHRYQFIYQPYNMNNIYIQKENEREKSSTNIDGTNKTWSIACDSQVVVLYRNVHSKIWTRHRR